MIRYQWLRKSHIEAEIEPGDAKKKGRAKQGQSLSQLPLEARER
jgi:hypothetical protein